jgi:Mg2+-importing ATPase
MIRFFGGWNDPALFRTGWFIESIFTQTLIIHVIRTRKIPFIQSRASFPLMLASAAVLLTAAFLPYSPLAPALGLVALPPLYWAFLAGMILSYLALTQAVKNRFNRSAQASPSLLPQR